MVQKDGSCTKSPPRTDRDRNRGSKFRRTVNQRHLERPLSHSFLVDSLRVVSVLNVSCIQTLQATPLNSKYILATSGLSLGRGLLANLRDKDNLSTADKTPVPNVSVVWRFHCIHTLILWDASLFEFW